MPGEKCSRMCETSPGDEDEDSKIRRRSLVQHPEGDMMPMAESPTNEGREMDQSGSDGASGKGNKGFNPGITNQQNTRLKETGTTKHVSDSENFFSNISEQDHEVYTKNYNDIDSEQNKFGRVERKTINSKKGPSDSLTDLSTTTNIIPGISRELDKDIINYKQMRMHSRNLKILHWISKNSLLYPSILSPIAPVCMVGKEIEDDENKSHHLQRDDVIDEDSENLNESMEEGESLNKTENFLLERTHISKTSSGDEEFEMGLNYSETFEVFSEKFVKPVDSTIKVSQLDFTIENYNLDNYEAKERIEDTESSHFSSKNSVSDQRLQHLFRRFSLRKPITSVCEVGMATKKDGNKFPHLQRDDVIDGDSEDSNDKMEKYSEHGYTLKQLIEKLDKLIYIILVIELHEPTKYYGIGVDMRSSTNTDKHCVKHRFFLLPLNEQYFKVLIKLIGLRFWTKVIPSCGVFYIIDSRTIEQNWNIGGVFEQKALLLKWAIFAYHNDENSDMSEKVDSPDFFGLDLLKFNGKNCGFNNLENNVNTRRKSENNEQSLYEEKSFVPNETKNNKKVLKSYSENFAAKKKQRRRGIPKRSKKVARRLRKTRKSIRKRKSCYRLVKKPWKTQSVREGSVLSTIVYNYTDIPETDNFMFPTNNQDSNRRSRQEHEQQQRSSVQRSQLESDTPGRVSDDVRDPPGQQSIYIPPGDNRLEQYRLSTFEHYPISSPTTRKSLAKAGFYFTGFFDRVKCFACARTVERWNNTDIPSDVRWHKESCPFPRGEDCGNVPIRSLFGGINIGGASAQWNSRQNEQVLEQRDPITGAITRVVRFPADLPERVRQTGGSFRIGPNNTVHIQNGPGTTRGRLPGVQQAPMPPNQWRMANVISSDHRRFLTNLHLNRELDRVASFARWPVGRPNVPPAALARTGFFYLGDMDRTQCFSCGGVLRNWTLEDDALDEHRSHFPACPMILGTEQRNVKVPEYPDTPDERATNFPCRFPSNPHMRNLAAREDTFDRRWPVGRTAATPAEISQAGFFFLGERDRVKCWYCNGGLQHWEYDDIPWVEHAKWFPTCQFLLQVKGQHFVYRHLSLSPHLARPIIACQDGSPLEGVNQPGRSHDIPPNVSRAQQPSPPPVIIDPQEEMRKRKERVEKEIKDSDVVKNVLAMGFSERIVRILLEEKIEANTEASSQEIYDSVAILLDDVVKKEEEIEREDQERRMNEQARSTEIAAQGAASMLFPSTSSVYSAATTPMSSLGPSPGSGKYQVSLFDENEDEEAMDQDMYGSVAGPSSQETTTKQVAGNEEMTPSLREQLHKIEEERMCKICFTNPAEMVFVPCGHICCCMQCTEAISHCPVCRVKIQRAIKTYLS